MTRTVEEVRQEIDEIKEKILEKEKHVSQLNQELSEIAGRNGTLNAEIQKTTEKVCELLKDLGCVNEENQRQKLSTVPKMTETVIEIDAYDHTVWERLNALAKAEPEDLKRQFAPHITQTHSNKVLTRALVAAAHIACAIFFVVM